MDRDVLPNVLWDPEEMSRSLARLRNLRDRGGATVIRARRRPVAGAAPAAAPLL